MGKGERIEGRTKKPNKTKKQKQNKTNPHTEVKKELHRYYDIARCESIMEVLKPLHKVDKKSNVIF